MTRKEFLTVTAGAVLTAMATRQSKAESVQTAVADTAGGFSEYGAYDAIGLAKLVRKGEVSALELLNAAISRTETVNPKINAVVYKHYDEARAAIKAGLPEGPFSGVPMLLKNLGIAMQGTVTSSGARFLMNHVEDHDSTLTRRYQAAGFVIFGKPTPLNSAWRSPRNRWPTARAGTPGTWNAPPVGRPAVRLQLFPPESYHWLMPRTAADRSESRHPAMASSG